MKKLKIISAFLVLLFYTGLSFAQQTLDDAKKLTVREQYSQSEEMFKNLISANPQNGDLYYYYGQNELNAFFSDTITLSLSETNSKCKKIFENGIEKDAGNPLNYIGLARLDYISRNKTGVTENVTKINTMIPPMTLKIKKIQDPQRYASILNEMSKIYIVAGNTDTASALPLLKRAVAVDSKNAEILINMGDAYLNVKDVNKAIENYNAAQTLNPKLPVAKLRIGYLYMRAKNPGAAIPYFEDALNIDPNFAPVYKELGFLYSRTGKSDKSKTNYQKYLELSGNNIPAKISYSIALFKAEDYKTCITEINEIFAVDSTINSMNRVIAYSYYEDKQYKRSLYYIQKFLKNINYDPDKIITRDYVYYGRTLGELGKADDAEVQLRKAISLDPTLANLYTDISNYQYKAKNIKKAIAALNDKVKANAAGPGDYYYLGKYYYSTADYPKSDSAFQTLLGLDPAKVKPYEMLALSWQGYARLNIDSTFQTGFAKPVYEKLIEKAKTDSVKYYKYLVDGYSYMGTYYWLNKTDKDYGKAKKYYLKVTAIDPNDVRAKKALMTPEISKAKLPD
jgi:tetratricopeptide (TPR) repeat protein